MKKARGIGKRVREHRLDAGLTQGETAAFMGLPSEAALCRIEIGQRKVKPKLRTILKAFLAIPAEAVAVRAAWDLGTLVGFEGYFSSCSSIRALAIASLTDV